MAAVTDVMTANPARCRADSPLQEVAHLMVEHDCGQIPVVDADDRPVGVITDRDIVVRVIATGQECRGATAGDAMSSPVSTVRQDTSLHDCVCLMEAEKVRRTPVVDDAGRLIGMVSIADLARAGKDEATASVVSKVSEPGQN